MDRGFMRAVSYRCYAAEDAGFFQGVVSADLWRIGHTGLRDWPFVIFCFVRAHFFGWFKLITRET